MPKSRRKTPVSRTTARRSAKSPKKTATVPKKTATGAKKSGAKKSGAKQRARPGASKVAAPRKPPQSAPYEQGKWAAAFAPRAPGERRYWLVKSEPDAFSFDDLLRAKDRTTHWDGVRNTAARNFLRDGMKLGDRVFYYHSMADPQAIVGICEVVREGYPDHTAFDPRHPQFDPESDSSAPMWYMVDLRAVEPLPRPVTLAEIKARPELAQMALVRVGRLSVSPVTVGEWESIREMGATPDS